MISYNTVETKIYVFQSTTLVQTELSEVLDKLLVMFSVCLCVRVCHHDKIWSWRTSFFLRERTLKQF